MTEHDSNKPTFSRMLATIVAAVFAAAALSVHAPAQAAAAPQTFDVASIRIKNTETDGHHHIISDPGESHFRTVNLALRDLIQFAYGVRNKAVNSINAIVKDQALCGVDKNPIIALLCIVK
jgi:hypothetical protein